MAEHVLMASGVLAGAMSTVAFSVGGAETDNNSGQTTTEAPQVQDWLRRMVDAGHLGRKSGRGFYEYDAGGEPR